MMALTLSVIDLEHSNEILHEFDNLIDDIDKKATKSLKTMIVEAKRSNDFGDDDLSLVDLKNFSVNLNPKLSNLISQHISTISSKNIENPGGISFYYPTRSFKNLEKYKQNSNFSKYKNYLNKYFAKDKMKRNLKFLVKGDKYSKQSNELYFSLTKDTIQYHQSTFLYIDSVTLDEVKGKYQLKDYLGTDMRVMQSTNEPKNEFLTAFDSKWFSLNGETINAFTLDMVQDANETRYVSMMKLNDYDGRFLFSYSHKDKTFKVHGFADSHDGLIGRIIKIKPEDKITIQGIKAKPTPGLVEYYDKKTILAKNLDLKFETIKDGAYMLTAGVLNVYGYKSYTNSILVKIKDQQTKYIGLVEQP